MKQKLPLFLALYLLAAFQYCFAQQTDYGYKIKKTSDGYLCSSNSIFKSMKNEKDNLYNVSFYANRFFGSECMILGIEIGTVGDQQVVSIARLDKNGEQVRSHATITLSNGHRFSCTIFVADITKSSLRSSNKTGQLNLNFVCNEPVSCLTMLRQYDIKTIEIGGYIVNMQNTTAKSAEIINNLCINLMKVVGTPSSYGSGPSISSYSSSGQPSQSYSGGSNIVKTNLTLNEMLAKPMGCIDSDMEKDAFNTIKSKTSSLFKIDESSYNTSNIFYVWENENNNCSNIKYQGMSFDNFRYDVSPAKKSIKYQFVLKKSDIESQDNAYKYLDVVVNDFKAMGIPISYSKWSDNMILSLGEVRVKNINYKISLETFGSNAWSIVIYKEIY